jgi:hypothetical protein
MGFPQMGAFGQPQGNFPGQEGPPGLPYGWVWGLASPGGGGMVLPPGGLPPQQPLGKFDPSTAPSGNCPYFTPDAKLLALRAIKGCRTLGWRCTTVKYDWADVDLCVGQNPGRQPSMSKRQQGQLQRALPPPGGLKRLQRGARPTWGSLMNSKRPRAKMMRRPRFSLFFLPFAKGAGLFFSPEARQGAWGVYRYMSCLSASLRQPFAPLPEHYRRYQGINARGNKLGAVCEPLHRIA